MVRTRKVAMWLPALLPFFFQSVLAGVRLPSGPALNAAEPSKSGIVPNAYFIQFKSGQSNGNAHNARSVDDTLHTAFESFLHQNNVDFTPRVKLTSTQLMSGMSVHTNHPNAHAVLSSFHGADKVYPVRYVSHDNLRRKRSQHSSLPARDGASTQNSNPVSVPPLSGPFAPHVLAGIDKVHASGNYGQDVVIAIIDTGIDYTHHALNGGKPDGTPCFGDGCLVIGGVSFWDQHGNLSITHDPYPYCDSHGEPQHGTHVAGIVAANDTIRGFTGGAPQAKLKAYRAFDCQGSGADDVIAAAYQRAFFDGADVISVSISSESGWRESYLNQLITRIVESGIAVVTSAGNVGSLGPFTAKAPAGAYGNHASAALFNPDLLGFTASASGPAGQESFVYLAANPMNLKQNKLSAYVYKVNGTVSDLCSLPANATLPNLEGKAVILYGGSCDTTTVAATLNGANATVALMANNADLFLPYIDGVANGNVQMAAIDVEKFNWIVNATGDQNNVVTIDFSSPQPGKLQDPEGGFTTFYSEYGPDWELNSYIGTAAVGGNVLSTFPLYKGGYGVISGTSMSTPLTASAVALYKSAKGKKETAIEIRAVFATTAEPIKYNSTSDVLETVAHQGGGRFNVARAIASTTRVWPEFHALNDTEFFNGTQTFTFTNVGSKPQQLSFSHLPAGTVYACNGSAAMQLKRHGPWVPVNADQATVTYSPAKASVGPGESTTVTVTYTAPKADPRQCAVYSGYTQVQSDDENGSLTVPYLGFASAMRSLASILYYSDDDSLVYAPSVIDPNTNRTIQDGTVFNLQGKLGQPWISYGSAAGSRLLTFDLVKADAVDAAHQRRHQHSRDVRRHLEHKRGIHHHARDASAPSTSSKSVPASAIYANLETIPLQPRTFYDLTEYTIIPTYTDSQNQTYPIEDGEYHVLTRQLKLRGDPHNEDDFESWLSPKFVIKTK